MNKPNLFRIATKELSQDAFLAWLISWADKKYSTENSKLHECGKDLIQHLAKPLSIKVNQVKVKLQWKGVDVRLIINDEYLIIIEDKTNSKEHGKQLDSYKKMAEEWCAKEEVNIKRENIIKIYLKTGSESSDSLSHIIERGWKLFMRKDLLAVLNNHEGIKNNIFEDFTANLNRIENEHKFSEIKISNWNHNTWRGFYMALEELKDKPVIKWHWVNNPTSSFVNCLLNWPDNENHLPVYAQLEQDNVRFKVSAEEKFTSKLQNNYSRALIRNHYSSKLIDSAKKNFPQIKRPERFGSGKWMTLAVIVSEDWMVIDNELINFEKTVANIRELNAFIKAFLLKKENHLE